MTDILFKSLARMPYHFTSNEFATVAKRNGLSQAKVNSGVCAEFLHKHCDKHGTRRSWTKRNLINVKEPDSLVSKLSETECIKFLKNKGYKIFKYTEL